MRGATTSLQKALRFRLREPFFETRAAAAEGLRGGEGERAQGHIQRRGEVTLAPFVVPGQFLQRGRAPGIGRTGQIGEGAPRGLIATRFFLETGDVPERPEIQVVGEPSFHRATDDLFFISVDVTDPKYDPVATKELLISLGTQELEEVKS